MRLGLISGAVLGLALAWPAMADDSIGKGPITIASAPIEQAPEGIAKVVWLDKAAEATKLMSWVGGDPAINGEYVFMVVHSEDMSQEDASFMIGDFNTWDIVEQTKDHVTLKIGRTWVVDATGEYQSVEEKWQIPMVPPTTRELKITILSSTPAK